VSRSAAEPLTPLAGSVGLVASLAAVAGFVDAISVARLTGAFVAFQSGNTILIGLGVANGRAHEFWPPAISVVAFVGGSALASMIIRSGPGPARGAQQRLLASAAGLLALDAALVLVGTGLGHERPVGAVRSLGIVVAAVSMALQTPVVRSVNGVQLSSTFVTGVLSRLGQALGDSAHADARAREGPVLRVLGVTTIAFFTGAVIGGVFIEEVGNTAILVPVAVLVVLALVVRRNWVDPAGL
jgi:uncharacterized membrane protein YoaK (UPF0700 family)